MTIEERVLKEIYTEEISNLQRKSIRMYEEELKKAVKLTIQEIKQIIKNRSNRKIYTLRKKEMKLDKKIYEAPKGSHEKKGWEQEMREINESIIHIRLFSDDILSKIEYGEKE